MTGKYVLDASAWVEYFGGSRKGERIRQIVEREAVSSSVMALAEVASKFGRERRPFDALVSFMQSRAAIVPVTAGIALTAARLKNEFRPRHPKFSLTDGIHLATAEQQDATLVTADTDFASAKNVLLVA